MNQSEEISPFYRVTVRADKLILKNDKRRYFIKNDRSFAADKKVYYITTGGYDWQTFIGRSHNATSCTLYSIARSEYPDYYLLCLKYKQDNDFHDIIVNLSLEDTKAVTQWFFPLLGHILTVQPFQGQSMSSSYCLRQSALKNQTSSKLRLA